MMRVPGVALRAYQPPHRSDGPVLLIVPAPVKRPYIWDLMPSASVVRAGLDRGVRIFLLEWLRPSRQDGFGLADYAVRLPRAAVHAITRETGVKRVSLAGHSLGGTFAAIFAAAHPELVGRLVLVDTPLAFGPCGGSLAEAARAPQSARIRHLVGSPVPGTVINVLSGTAAPQDLIWSRWIDLIASLGRPAALEAHLRVARWSLDEFPLPAQLFEDVVEDLYRNDRFLSGTLVVDEKPIGIAQLRAPTIGVVNPGSGVVPSESLTEGLRRAVAPHRLLQHQPEPGSMLPHLGPLVGRSAHRALWPRIMTWLGS